MEGKGIKILAIEKGVQGLAQKAFGPYLKEEAERAWELYQKEVLRKLFFRKDWPGTVLVLECSDAPF